MKDDNNLGMVTRLIAEKERGGVGECVVKDGRALLVDRCNPGEGYGLEEVGVAIPSPRPALPAASRLEK
jgi:hypothetical protein